MATKLICDRCHKEATKLYAFESRKIKDLSDDSFCDESELIRSKELCLACETAVWETINVRFSV